MNVGSNPARLHHPLTLVGVAVAVFRPLHKGNEICPPKGEGRGDAKMKNIAFMLLFGTAITLSSVNVVAQDLPGTELPSKNGGGMLVNPAVSAMGYTAFEVVCSPEVPGAIGGAIGGATGYILRRPIIGTTVGGAITGHLSRYSVHCVVP